MSKRKRSKRKSAAVNIRENTFLVMTKEEATLAKLPKYNPYQTGYGAHGKRKYDRAAEKRKFNQEVDRSASYNESLILL